MSIRLEALLDRDIATLTDPEVDYLREEKPEHLTATVERLSELFDHPGCALKPEVAYFLARLKSRHDDPATPEHLLLDLALIELLPRSLDYYRQRAEEARRPRRVMSVGVRRGR
jgi:hypothetical protein